MSITESVVEDATLAWLEALGYAVLHGPDIGAGEPGAERSAPNYRDVLLEQRLRQALVRLNPDLPPDALNDAYRKFTLVDAPSLAERNRAVHRMLDAGVTVEYRRKDGSIAGAQARVIDFDTPTDDDWLAVNQFTVSEGQHTRRPDVVRFVNGLVAAAIELENPADEHATVWSVGQQPQTYQAQIPVLRMSNVALPASGGEVIVYEAPNGEVRVDVRLDRETVWLSLNQMAELFGRDKSVVSRHLRNVFRSGELDREAVVARSATTAADGKTYQVEFFNLDAILSVGYRVNSKRGTQFRIWATHTLRDHLVRGYTLHERRLAERGLGEIEQAVGLLARTLTTHALITDEGLAVLDVVRRYTRSWRLLRDYDEERLAEKPAHPVTPGDGLLLVEAREAALRLREDLAGRGEAGVLFGHERGDALAGILGAIEQTFGDEALYPSAQARAARLLYFVIKDQPFSDGNKRIGTLLFLDYLRRNGLLLRADGEPRLADNAMVALALLIAESEPKQKDLMIRLVFNLLDADAP